MPDLLHPLDLPLVAPLLGRLVARLPHRLAVLLEAELADDKLLVQRGEYLQGITSEVITTISKERV